MSRVLSFKIYTLFKYIIKILKNKQNYVFNKLKVSRAITSSSSVEIT